MSDELDAIDDALANAATEPASATVDGQSATARSVDELLKLRQFQAAEDSAASSVSGFGIRFQKIIPPGCG